MALISSPMSRANIPDLLELGIRQVFVSEYELVDNQYEQIYNVVGSRKRQERDVFTSGLGTFQVKSEGRSPFFDSGQEAWLKTYIHNTWALGIEITQEGMEDDLYDFYMSMGKELGRAGAYTQQVEAFDLFNNLTATVYTANSTNYTLLSTTQFRADGGSWPNRLTNPTDLSIESLETALSTWRTSMLDQRGRKTLIRPKYLMVGPSDEWVAHRILMTEYRPGSADNDVNAVKARRDLQIFVADFLTDDGRWFLLADKPQTGLRYNLRVKREVQRRDDSRTGNLLMVSRYRESHGASHVYGVFGSP